MVAVVEQERVKVRGAGWQLLKDLRDYDGEPKVLEYMLDGPRGTSKTVSVGFILRHLADRYPGIRMLVVRKTRRSLSESWCPDWEAIVCGGNDECLSSVKPEGRSAYRWDSTNSSMVLRGMDDTHKSYGTSYDVIVVDEAFEFFEDEIEQFTAMLRNWCTGLKWQLLVLLTNPRHPKHWLLSRVKRGLLTRYQSLHIDNPKWYDAKLNKWTPKGRAYCKNLSNMTGVRRRRLFLGEWCAAEGAVWEAWEESREDGSERHVISRKPEPTEVRWYGAAMDWGFTDACVLLVAAIGQTADKKRKTITIVREVYLSKQSIESWGGRVLQAYKDFGIAALVVDPSRPEIVDYFNQVLIAAHPHLRDHPVARSADNVRHASTPKGDLAGIDLVRQYIEEDRIKYVRGAREHEDDVVLREKNRACSLLDEIPDYVFRERKDDPNDMSDQTDPACDDHACDALRYLVTFAHGNDMSSRTQRILSPDLPSWEAADLEMLGR